MEPGIAIAPELVGEGIIAEVTVVVLGTVAVPTVSDVASADVVGDEPVTVVEAVAVDWEGFVGPVVVVVDVPVGVATVCVVVELPSTPTNGGHSPTSDGTTLFHMRRSFGR